MARLLIIEDEKLYQKMVAHAVQPLGFEIMVAGNGAQGLVLANQNPPDLIICDVMMETLNGYETVRRLRRDPRFAHTPIIFLTAQCELNDKLAAFEAGGDDFITKPFETAELLARINVLMRRNEQVRTVDPHSLKIEGRNARIIAVHSLRGGVGCSSFSTNLGIALHKMWGAPTLLLDMVLTAGQTALMLDAPLKRTWADIAEINPQELDWDVLQSIIGRHDSGVDFIAAPTYPSEAELITQELFAEAFKLLRVSFDYIVADLPHDFSMITLDVLDAADVIVVLLAPEIASLRAAIASLDTFKKLGFPHDKIRLGLNTTFERKGIPRKKVEAALNYPVDLVLPFAPDLFIDAINTGKPILYAQPDEVVAETIRNFAKELSLPEHRGRVGLMGGIPKQGIKGIFNPLKK